MKKGFTLAELMAVVVIIAIIASIGLGGYKRTVERAKLTEGLNMGHQIAQALARADYERHGQCGSFDTPWTQLDIDTNSSSGSSQMGTNSINLEGRFTITRNGSNIVVRRIGGENYQINIPIDCGVGNAILKDSCTGNTDFCISAGYSNCSGSSCMKP